MPTTRGVRKDARPACTRAAHALTVSIGLLLVSAGSPVSAADSGVLAVFTPGVPGEPQWVMLKLESTVPGAKPEIQVSFGEMRCPFVLHFAVLHGSPSNATAVNSVTMNFVKGQGGVAVEAQGARVGFGNTQAGASDACVLTSTIGATFGALPVGPSYFLMLAAGGPVEATARLTAPSTVEVVGTSSGHDTFFRGPNDFSGGTHVMASSPPTCTSPSIAAPGACEPCCLQPSGGVVGFDASLDRKTTMTFRHHPYLRLATGVGSIGASNVTVTMPFGEVLSGASFASANGVGIMSQGVRLFRTAGVPSGEYELAVHRSVDANTLASPGWHAWAVDLRFPEETSGK